MWWEGLGGGADLVLSGRSRLLRGSEEAAVHLDVAVLYFRVRPRHWVFQYLSFLSSLGLDLVQRWECV